MTVPKRTESPFLGDTVRDEDLRRAPALLPMCDDPTEAPTRLPDPVPRSDTPRVVRGAPRRTAVQDATTLLLGVGAGLSFALGVAIALG